MPAPKDAHHVRPRHRGRMAALRCVLALLTGTAPLPLPAQEHIPEAAQALTTEATKAFVTEATQPLAAEAADTVRTLREVEIRQRTSPQGVSVNDRGDATISSAALSRGMRSMGQADALLTALKLPGIDRGSDYSSGMTVEGSGDRENAYLLDGARIWFPYRFGGIFSSYNTNHISTLGISTRPAPGGPHRAGATVSGDTRIPPGTHGTLDAGILATSATVSGGTKGGTRIKASARVSYLNAIYNNVINDADRDIRYGFDDYNLTATHSLGAGRTLKVSGYLSNDRLHLSDGTYTLGTHLRWRNAAGSAAYRRETARRSSTYRLSASALSSYLDITMSGFRLTMPTQVAQITADGHTTLHTGHWQYGYRAEIQRVTPLHATITATHGDDAATLSADATRAWQSGEHQLSATLRPTLYARGSYRHAALDPSVTYTAHAGASTYSASLTTATQHVHQVGLSDIGLASSFWFNSTRRLPPQRSYGIDLAYSRRWSAAILRASVYARRVTHAPEYTGDMLSLMQPRYDAAADVRMTHGYNTGGHLTAIYEGPTLGGWVGYQVSVCRRRCEGSYWTWASGVPLQALKAQVTWHAQERLDVSAYFTASSGRPYTPVRSIYMVGGNVLTEYGRHNSARLPTYQRLDVSATWHLKPLRAIRNTVNHFINISIINAYGHRNVEMQYFTYDEKDQTIYLHRVSSLYRFMPSVSYTVSF